MKDFKSKKTLIIIAIIIIGIISGCLLMTKTTNGKLFSSEPKVKITKIQYYYIIAPLQI